LCLIIDPAGCNLHDLCHPTTFNLDPVRVGGSVKIWTNRGCDNSKCRKPWPQEMRNDTRAFQYLTLLDLVNPMVRFPVFTLQYVSARIAIVISIRHCCAHCSFQEVSVSRDFEAEGSGIGWVLSLAGIPERSCRVAKTYPGIRHDACGRTREVGAVQIRSNPRKTISQSLLGTECCKF
jgi:hypothetical protein